MGSQLRQRLFTPLPLGQIKPTGWLRQQLQIQADGLSGALDQFWPDIQDSSWFGGSAEGWERAPRGGTDGVYRAAQSSRAGVRRCSQRRDGLRYTTVALWLWWSTDGKCIAGRHRVAF